MKIRIFWVLLFLIICIYLFWKHNTLSDPSSRIKEVQHKDLRIIKPATVEDGQRPLERAIQYNAKQEDNVFKKALKPSRPRGQKIQKAVGSNSEPKNN
jgi:hypothetical protein